MNCEMNTDYFRLGHACEPTCLDQTPGSCASPDTEVCTCKLGYVRNDNWDCVLPEACSLASCVHNGIRYAVSQEQ